MNIQSDPYAQALAVAAAAAEQHPLLFETMQEGYFLAEAVLDEHQEPVDWRILEANPAYGRIIGRESREVLGRTLLELAPGVEPHWLEAFREAAYGIRPIKLEGWTGTTGRYYESTLYSPRPGRFVCFFTDITDRRWALEHQAERENLFRGVFEHIPVALAVEDLPQGRFLAVNRTFEALTGYPPEALLGRTAAEVGLWGVQEGRQAILADWASRAPEATFELTIHRRDGALRRVEASPRPVELGGQSCLLVSAVDITERHRLEQERAERSRLLDRFMEHTPVAFAMVDRDLRYLFASHRWFTDYGREPRGFLGRTLYEVNPPGPERWKEDHRRCLAGATLKGEDVVPFGAGGAPIRVAWEIRPWEEAPGLIGGLILTAERSPLG